MAQDRCRRAVRAHRPDSADSWCLVPRSPGLLRRTSRGEDATTSGVGLLHHPVAIEIIVLPGLIDLENEAGRREHVGRQVRRVGVAHDHGGEGVVLHLAEQVQAIEALQVVEAVAALQLLHLDFEDEVEGRAEHAAEGHDLFGETADPEVDKIQTTEIAGVLSGAVEEILPILLIEGCQRPQDIELDVINQDLVAAAAGLCDFDPEGLAGNAQPRWPLFGRSPSTSCHQQAR